MPPQQRHVGGGDPFGSGPCGARLQQGAGLEHFAGLAHGGLGDKGAAIAPQLHQPVMGQALQRRAHGGAADAVDLAQLVLAQLGPRRQPVFVNGPLQIRRDGFGGGRARSQLVHVTSQVLQ